MWVTNIGYDSLADSEHVNGSSENLKYMSFVTEIRYKYSAKVLT